MFENAKQRQKGKTKEMNNIGAAINKAIAYVNSIDTAQHFLILRRNWMAEKNMNEPSQSNRKQMPTEPTNQPTDTQRVPVIANISSTMIPVKTNSSHRLFSIYLFHFCFVFFMECIVFRLSSMYKRHVLTLIHSKMRWKKGINKCHQTHAHQSPIYLIPNAVHANTIRWYATILT